MSIWQIGESGTEIPLDDDGQGEVSFTVTNNGTAQDRAVLTVTPLDGAAHEWFTVPEPQKAVAATQSAAFACKVKVPAGTPPATYALQAVVYSADSTPDETSTTSRRVTFTVAAEPAEPKARIPWWVFAIIGAVVLAVIAVVLAFVLRDDSDEATVTNVEPPVITGTPQVGALLEVDIGTWSVARSELTPSFQWERCTGADDASCQSIDEARTAQYVAAIEDEGMTLHAIVGVRPKQESDTSSTVTSLPDADAVAPVASATSQRTEVVGPPAEPDPQAVPNVVGLLVSQATAALTPPALPFQVALLTAGDAVATCDPVVEDQDPDAGTSLAPGSKVTLSVRPTGFIFCGVILEGPILLDPALFPGLVESQP